MEEAADIRAREAEERAQREAEEREIEMERLREQMARDRDEENRQTEADRNRELQDQLKVIHSYIRGIYYGIGGDNTGNCGGKRGYSLIERSTCAGIAMWRVVRAVSTVLAVRRLAATSRAHRWDRLYDWLRWCVTFTVVPIRSNAIKRRPMSPNGAQRRASVLET